MFDQGNFTGALAEFEAVPSGSSVHSAAVRNAALAREAPARQPDELTLRWSERVIDKVPGPYAGVRADQLKR